MKFNYKVGFLGAGNLTTALIKGFLDSENLSPSQIYVSNRSPGKLQKMTEAFGINAVPNNEALVEKCEILILATKPQDLMSAIEPLSSQLSPNQIVVSLAAGIKLETLKKTLRSVRITRVMPNTPSFIRRGVLGYLSSEASTDATIEDLFSASGTVIKVDDEDQLEAVTVSCASGTGFIFELMSYWQDWIEERGIEPNIAKQMTIETFLGTAMLAAQAKDSSLEELLGKVTSKKGTTSAGLESMRELEIERALRISFEKAALRNQELAKL